MGWCDIADLVGMAARETFLAAGRAPRLYAASAGSAVLQSFCLPANGLVRAGRLAAANHQRSGLS